VNKTELFTILYAGKTSCLHVDGYFIRNPYGDIRCGPCSFRTGFWDEMPGRMSVKEFSGLYGAPKLDPRTEAHIMASAGLIMPMPDEALKSFRRRRKRLSQPTASLFPYISALWHLTGYQPPLARVLIRFVEGRSEAEIASEMDQSLYNVQQRLAKSVRVANRFLRM
jgi:hypothetical protein